MSMRKTFKYDEFNGGRFYKTKNALGKSTVEEMEEMSEDDLKRVILSANQAMQEANDELEKNENYQQIKKDKSLLEIGKREVDKRQKARVRYALHLLEEKGKLL